MRIVEMDRDFVRKIVPPPALTLLESANHVLDRRGNEKALLLQPQLASGRLIVRRIQHLRDVLAAGLVLDRLDVLAFVEFLEIEFAR